MRIMTEAYKDVTYFIPLNGQKTEGIYVKPLSSTERRRISLEAVRESGGDMSVAAHLEAVKMLQSGLVGWKGIYDMGRNEVPFSAEMIKVACEYDPDIMAQFLARMKNVARFGEEDDRKN